MLFRSPADVKMLPAVPAAILPIVEDEDAYKISPVVYDANPVPPFVADIAVPDQTPEVITLLEKPTPEIEAKFVVAVHKDPPIPTPPETVREPVDVDVDAVLEVTATPEANVLAPKIV